MQFKNHHKQTKLQHVNMKQCKMNTIIKDQASVSILLAFFFHITNISNYSEAFVTFHFC
jgi:hypothetical protein